MAVINNVEKVAVILRNQGVISPEQLQEIRRLMEPPPTRHRRRAVHELRKARKEEKYAPDVISAMKLFSIAGKPVDEELIISVVAKEYGIPFRKVDPLDMDAKVVSETLPKPFALKHHVLPVALLGRELTVATPEPEDAAVVQQIVVATGYRVNHVLSARSEIDKTLKQFFGFQTSVAMAEKEVTGQQAGLANLEQLSKLKSEDEISSSDLHIQNAVDLLLHYALTNRASDIHLEPKREHTVVRMRIDGALVETQKIPRVVHGAIISRIKILARMDISEKRRPQDGRIKVQREGKESEMRVSVLPVAFGEKAVIRIFDAEMALKSLEVLGFFPEELETYKRFLAKPNGIILVTGQTGSGKTSTLYSSLKHLYTPETNIVTIEDPIEMVVPEFNQVAVNPAIDLTFASALRSILRQDPDIIMVGEIRDRETAENAVQAALTGHLVLSTLHTNDTASSLTRLYDIGIEPYQIRSTLIGLVSQRLVRVICEHCKTDVVVAPEELKAAGIANSKPLTLKKGAGCDKCRFTGYYGRTGVHEVMDITENLRNMIDGETPDTAIRQAARKAGMRILQENAVRKMLAGVTTLDEVLRLFSL
ncbi:MAG: Flp pilus assembly complex ATPase component TadA [Nitrospinae bacterium]|nr:Flp pilus assembly complex ATPase component TadA [Nitrospinota bacterium]